MADEERTLVRRNHLLHQTNQTGQAMLGLIGADLLTIAIEAQQEAVVLRFAVAARTAELQQDSRACAPERVIEPLDCG